MWIATTTSAVIEHVCCRFGIYKSVCGNEIHASPSMTAMITTGLTRNILLGSVSAAAFETVSITGDPGASDS